MMLNRFCFTFFCLYGLLSFINFADAQQNKDMALISSITDQDSIQKLNQKNFTISPEQLTAFSDIYKEDLTPNTLCRSNTTKIIKLCSDLLRNEGNSPFILVPDIYPVGVVVLFHGLSDSPYFISSIAQHMQKRGYLVVAPLTPGHGKKEADADMQDDNLLSRWYQHTDDVMKFANSFNLPVVAGGFSTGGAFATHYALNHPTELDALLLFSAALELTGSAEAMSNVWGIKSLAKLLDGTYLTNGAHPFKYPSVASYSGLVLMDIIKDIRSKLEETQITIPIFAAHSMADNVTLFSGIEHLTGRVSGNHTIFKIDESYDLCHADLPMSAIQMVNLKFDKNKVNTNERCAVPKANPLHGQMIMMLDFFLQNNT